MPDPEDEVEPEQLHFEDMGFSKREAREMIASIRQVLADARANAELLDEEVNK